MPKSIRFQLTLLFVCLYFLGATLILTWPLVTGLNQVVPGYPGDNLFFVWLIEWYQKAIFQLHTSPWFVPALNYPEGYSLGYTEFSPATVFTALPVSLVFGPIAGYNAVILSTFVLSGLGVFLWVLQLTNDSRAALISGTIFTFCTYRMNHLGGHITLEGTQWLPFYFFTLQRVLDARAWQWEKITAAAVFLMLMSLTAPYYLYMSLVLSLPYVIGYLHLRPRPASSHGNAEEPRQFLCSDRQSSRAARKWFRLNVWIRRTVDSIAWQRFLVICLLAAPVSVLGFWPYIQLRLAGQFEPHPFSEASFYSASPTDFLVAMTSHLLIGAMFVRAYHGENALYLGVFAVALACVALARYRKRSSLKLFAWMSLCAAVLAMGVALHYQTTEILVAVPDFIQTWWPHPQVFIPLPGYLLYQYLPFYASMRVWLRYGLFVSMFFSVMAGLGAAWLLVRFQARWQSLVTFSILGLVLLDSYVGPFGVTPVTPRPVDAWLAAQPGQGAVATFPFDEAGQPLQTYFASVYDKPFIGGHFAAFRSPQFERIVPILERFPDPDSLAVLKQLEVQYILVDSPLYNDYATVNRTIESLGLHLLTAIEGTYVYEMPR